MSSRFTVITSVLSLLSPREKRMLVLLFAAVLATAIMETIGVGSVLPFMTLAANPSIVHGSNVYGRIYRLLGSPAESTFILLAGLGVIFVLVTGNGLSALTSYGIIRYTSMRGFAFSTRLLDNYLGRDYAYFLDSNSATLSRNVLQEVYRVISGVLVPILDAGARGCVAFFIVLFLFVLDPVTALVTIVVLGGLYSGVYLWSRRRLALYGRERLEASRVRFKAIHEVFNSIKDVKLYHAGPHFQSVFYANSLISAKREASASMISRLPRFALEAIAFSSVVLVLLLFLGQRGGFEAAVPFVGAYAVAGYKLMPALQTVLADISAIRYQSTSLDVVKADLYLEAAKIKQVRGVIPPSIERINFKDVHYAYSRQSEPAVAGVSFSISANTIVGIVGETGSGKTTIVDLMLGLLDPSDGAIMINDVPLARNIVEEWQERLGYVPQQISLVDDSVTRNIAFGIPDNRIDHEAVKRAAGIAKIDRFIEEELPDVYDTRIGERGVRLSGGQRQRIGIARALYRDPEILILDEATSALDNMTEQAVMDAINNLGHTKTIVMIAHRISTVRDCDQIIVTDRGRVVGIGTYAELLEGNDVFKAIAR